MISGAIEYIGRIRDLGKGQSIRIDQENFGIAISVSAGHQLARGNKGNRITVVAD